MDKENKLMELERELKSEENEHKRLHLLLSIAEVNWQKGEYSICKKSAEKAGIYAKQLNNEEYLARSYYLIGLANNYLNLYDEALENHQKALQINKKLGLSNVVAEGLNNIGQIYLNINDFDKAEEYFKNSIEYNPEYARGYNNLGVVGIRRENLKEALKYMLKGLELLEKSDFPDIKRSRVIAMINISQIYLKMDEFDKALKYAESAQDLSKTQNNDTQIYGIMNYSSILLDLKYFERAKKHLLEALELAKKQENRETLKEIYYLLSYTCENQNDCDSSLYFLKKHIALEKKIYQESLSKRLAEIQTVYEEENQMLKAQQMIEKASKIATVGAMAAAITHEINQPLCAVKVSADSILYWKKKRGISFPSDIEESLNTITEASDLIDDIIQHVRSFWRPRENTEQGSALINETIQKALGLLERQIFSHGIFLDLQLHNKEIEVDMLPVHLEQILINIIVNAVHALDESSNSTKKIIIRTGFDLQKAFIEIQDNGCGISKELEDKIFDPFYTSKKNGKGMGLGLAIVDNYVRKYNGKIKVGNAEEGGAIFKILFAGVER